MRGALQGIRLLVVEDEFFAAMELQRMIEEMGGEVIGPVARLREAEKLASEAQFDGAVLDVRLADETTVSLASALLDRAIPIVLSTGYESDMLSERLVAVPRLPKPFNEVEFRRLAREHFAREHAA